MHIYDYFLWIKLVEIELMGQAHKLSLSYSLSLPPYGSKAQNPKYMFFHHWTLFVSSIRSFWGLQNIP